MINKLYFSPTGGTKKAVDFIAEGWGGEEREIDFSAFDVDYSVYCFKKEDICIIGVPSFGGRVPAIALERLLQMKAEETPAILVAAYGNRDYDDTIQELKAAVTSRGFKAIAAVAAVTEHSIMRQFAAGRPDAQDEKTLRGYGTAIRQAFENSNGLTLCEVNGNMPYREYGGLPMKPRADKTCTKCGICAKACPVNAIPLDNPTKTIKDKCITCMRCVAICPQHTRSLNAAMLFVAENKMKTACTSPKENVLFMGKSM